LKRDVEEKANGILEKELKTEAYNPNTSMQLSKDLAAKLLAQVKGKRKKRI
jgi:hypothetical protein